MSAKVTYTLDDSNELSIAYEAVCTEDTPINMTNHAYFNLGSYKRPNVLSQELRLSASRYTPIDEDSIPTGEIRDVTGTAFDFRQMKAIGRDIDQTTSSSLSDATATTIIFASMRARRRVRDCI